MTVNGGQSYCPNMAQLAQSGINFTQALTSRPSDSFPGLVGIITGATPRTAGIYYDVSYDRSLAPPTQTTPYGIVGGSNLCPGNVGTQVGFDEEIDLDYTQLDGGGGIDFNYLPRNPNNGCLPVYPHNYIRVNTVFEVVKNNGGYTAWSDKHPSYDFTNGPSGTGVTDLWSPEINSVPVPIESVPGCNPLPDSYAITSSNAWTDSFQNIQCYDGYKVNAIINEINGKNHSGTTTTQVPTLFGMNFQAVSVGQKLVEKALATTGGYMDPLGTPSPALMNEIQFVDNSIGSMVSALQQAGLAESTLVIISAKHGQSPIDPNRVLRIPADNSALTAPSNIRGGLGTGLVGGGLVGQADEDDISMLWLTDPTQIASSVALLAKNESMYGQGEIFAGNSLNMLFGNPSTDPRVPDIIIAPNVGVIYTGGKSKVAEHGGFSNDDRNVMLLVSNPLINGGTFNDPVEARQIAPSILQALGINPDQLEAVLLEKTAPLPLPY